LNKINIVTAPDQLFNDSFEILLLYPNKTLQNELQQKFLAQVDYDVNIYLYDKDRYDADELDWAMQIFKSVNVVIVDVDNTSSFFRDVLAYMIGKNKTYWLTNAEKSVYNHISKQRVYNLDFLVNIGEQSAQT
jgi:hypothetical protein